MMNNIHISFKSDPVWCSLDLQVSGITEEVVLNLNLGRRNTFQSIYTKHLILKQKHCRCHLGYMIYKKRWRRRFSECDKARSNQMNRVSKGFFEISNKEISEFLNISISTSHELKKCAANSGYIDVKKNYIETGVPLKEIELFRKYFPEPEKIEIKNNQVLVRNSDLIRSNVHLRRKRSRKKIETL